MTKTRYLMTLMVVASVATTCAAATDDEIRHYLVGSMLYIDNVNGARRDFRRARELCGEDTNRFARLICEIAHTNDSWIAEGMIRDLGTYGTSAQLPFLYSQVSNTQYGVDAVRSILEIEGITSNSVAMVDGYLSNTNNTNRNRYYVCSDFVVKAFAPDVLADLRMSASRVYFRFMKDDNIFNDWLDGTMKSVDPTYVHSKRRLAVMRAARVRTTDPEDLNYITNAINELVAYPESELPE